jgi:25S rRNA (cytosine2278-C5)-methyltransferase
MIQVIYFVIPSNSTPNGICCIDRASSVVRCSPDEDATNGFFVSCFVKGKVEEASPVQDILKRKVEDGDEISERKAKKKKKPKKKKVPAVERGQ